MRTVKAIALSVGHGYMAGVVGLYTRWGTWGKEEVGRRSAYWKHGKEVMVDNLIALDRVR